VPSASGLSRAIWWPKRRLTTHQDRTSCGRRVHHVPSCVNVPQTTGDAPSSLWSLDGLQPPC
jgi:hypothetical protein